MDKELTLKEHLEELRRRIIVSLVCLGVATTLSFPFSDYILKVLKFPAKGLIEKLVFFGPQDAFLIYMRIAFLSGAIFSFPIILYQLWAFILPALEEKFKKYTFLFIILSTLFFIGGCFFAYFILIPAALKFLLSFGDKELIPVISATRYISFLLSIILVSGLIFEMPLLSLILTKMGIINHRILRKKYKYAILVILIFSAIVTPTVDAFNMLLLAIPILVLYELSIWFSFLIKR
ncbi:MAG: twin-arginine translocase subunit TatC [Candidatus Omnitrophica bacterium]|nr:twin-arginine translocase subunit TatC [Candidatus Omnitrophota bacterium]MCM8799655.1 twin-arginine translocase subunit TatC [Candidatus Omnitrophota bacterium]